MRLPEMVDLLITEGQKRVYPNRDGVNLQQGLGHPQSKHLELLSSSEVQKRKLQKPAMLCGKRIVHNASMRSGDLGQKIIVLTDDNVFIGSSFF